MKNKFALAVACLILITMLAMPILTLSACTKTAGDSDSTNIEQSTNDETQNIITVDELSIGVICDTHVIADENLQETTTNQYYNRFQIINANVKMNELSVPVLKTSVDKFIESEVDVVLMIGDLTLDGAINSLEVVAGECQRLQDAGIAVYVAGGVCDINNGITGEEIKISTDIKNADAEKLKTSETYATLVSRIKALDDDTLYASLYTSGNDLNFAPTATAKDFADIFADYGLNDAISRDSNSLSYACDIPGTNYRLIVVDNASYYDGEKRLNMDYSEANPMPNGQMDWIEQALLDANTLGKETLVMTNVPLNANVTSVCNYFISDTRLTMREGTVLEEMFAKAGVKYVFSGHTHMNAVNEIQTKYGTLTEIYTSNTTTYPCSIRYFDIAKDYSYTTSAPELDKLKSEYITNSAVSEEDKLAASTGFKAFAEHEVKRYLTAIFHKNTYLRGNKTNMEILLFYLDTLTIYPTGNDINDAEILTMSKDILNWMQEINNMPIYGEGNTIEAVCKQYGINMPESRYSGYTTCEFVMNIFLRMLNSSFELLQDGADSKIFTRIFQVGLLKFCDIDLFGRLNAINSVVRDCDMLPMVENFFRTGNLDLTKDDFILSVASLLFPVLRAKGIILNPADSASLLGTIAPFMPIINTFVDDLILFCNEDGLLETDSYSLSNGIVYGQKFIENIFFSILARSCLIN